MTSEPLRRCSLCGHLAYRFRECLTCRLLRERRIHDDRIPRVTAAWAGKP